MTDDTTSTPPPETPSPSTRRLTRSPHDRVLGGVAGGLGAYFDVDPVLIRIVFVIACFFGGSGLFAYLALWLLVPEAGEDAAPARRYLDEHRGRDLPFWLGVGALALAALIVADNVGLFANGWAWPLILIGIGVALWSAGGRGGGPVTATEEPTEAPSPVDVPADRTASTTSDDVGGPPATPPGTESRAPRPRRPRRERSYLGRLTVGAALIVVGLAALGGATAAQLFAAALATVAVGLLVGSWVGRSRGLIVLGLVLAPLALAASVFDDLPSPFGTDGAGERRYTVSAVEQLRDEYALGAGQLELDLSALRLDGEQVQLDVRIGAGQVVVTLPSSAGYAIDAELRVGEIELPNGVSDTGYRARASASRDGNGLIRLSIQGGVGDIQVVQRAADATSSDREEVGA